MKGYHTEQKQKVLQFLTQHAKEQFTMQELVTRLSAEQGVGESTVYRLVQGLVSEGQVRRFVVANNRRFYYQLVAGKSCECHLHLKCLSCGQLEHLDGFVSAFMQQQVLSTHHFAIDEQKTMLFGHCHDCSQNKKRDTGL